MVQSVEKLGRYLKFPSRPDDRRLKSDAQSAPLCDFRSKISEFIAGMLLPGSELLSLSGFSKCFELIHTTNRAFTELAVEIDFPMRQWGADLTGEYLSCTSDLLSLSNTVTSSVSHLTHSKMCLLHAVTLLNGSPPSAARRLDKIAARAQKLKFEMAIGVGERQSCSRKERVLIQALLLCKKVGLLALGFVASALCGGAEPYLEIRRYAGGFDDSLLKEVDSRFYRELMGLHLQGVVMAMEEVSEVNMAIDRLTAVGSESSDDGRRCGEELKRRLKVLENSLQGIEKLTNNLFSQVLNARNKLLANITFTE